MRFSARLAANQKRPLILDDAPRPLRIGYIKRILNRYVGGPRGYGNNCKEPLDANEMHQNFIALIREEGDPWDFDENSSWAALTEHLKCCEWTAFYDFVEMLGAQLIEKDDEIPFDATVHFSTYMSQVNALFAEDGIGWALNNKSELVRVHPKVLVDSLSAADSALSKDFQTARIHYKKSVDYLYRHPIDEANSIKEIISAVESVARVIEPKASTLGDAIKRLRKDSQFNSMLLDPLEKLYVYCNATALVRHGHSDGVTPTTSDAELALLIGVGYIRYLIEVNERIGD